jgi:hypothetical protein
MSEPFLERLSRFTPDAGKLDRDALLFAAGRGSARPNRRWVALAAMLASTQVLSLAFLWARPAPPVGGPAVQVATGPTPATAHETALAQALANPGVWTARHSLEESDLADRPDDTVTFIESEPPLRALGQLPESILN